MSRLARAASAALVLLLVVACLAVACLAAPASAAPRAGAPRSPSRSFIVLVKPGVDPKAVAADYHRRLHARIRYIYRRTVRGFAASLPVSRVAALAHDNRVEGTEPDQRMRLSALDWGLDRIDQRGLQLDGRFAPSGTGAGVTAFIIDTGIRASHRDFGGRARSGYDAIDGGRATDCNGHGTHVAGTVGGSVSGVAKAVQLVAVRVLDCNGGGDNSSVIAGIEWVTAHHKPGSPAVANMSLGGPPSTALDRAVARAIASGVTFVVAAGNDGADACTGSPSRLPAAITVAASGPHDRRPPWSDYGRCVDMFAPGVGIRSAWFTGDTATRVLDGTSMASPHVAGAAALYLQAHPTAAPNAVAAALAGAGTRDAIADDRSPGAPLLFVGPQ